MIHSFYMFYERQCILKIHFSDACKNAIRKTASVDKLMSQEDYETYSNNLYNKLMCGFFTGLNQFSGTIADEEVQEGISVANFNTCSTPNYKIHYLQPLTGYRLVCFTSPDVPSLKNVLETIYSEVVVNKLLLNPDYKIGSVVDDLHIFNSIEKVLAI